MDALWTPQYYQCVLATNPIVYWMLDEKTGTVAYDLVSGRVAGAQNGTHVSVTLAEPGIGDGRTSGWYDSVTAYTNIYSAALNTAFNGVTGSMMIWARTNDAGIWTDGTIRVAMQLFADADNFVRLDRSATNNRLDWIYRAGGVTSQRVSDVGPVTDWMCMAITWNAPADEVYAYYNGEQVPVAVVGLGVWGAVPLSATRTLCGSNSTGPSNEWHGWLDHAVVWDRVLTPTEIAELYVVP